MLWGLLQNKEAAMKTMVVALEEQEKKSTQKHEGMLLVISVREILSLT